MEATEKPRTIAKVYHKVGLYDQPTDFAYWQSQPFAARLAALEAIRCEYHGWRHDTQPIIQKDANTVNHVQISDQSLLRRTVVEVANLPDDDLAILLDVVALLKQQRTTEMTADIRQAARQRALALRSIPRDRLAAQFREVGERIRSQAVASGTAIDGDWQGD